MLYGNDHHRATLPSMQKDAVGASGINYRSGRCVCVPGLQKALPMDHRAVCWEQHGIFRHKGDIIMTITELSREFCRQNGICWHDFWENDYLYCKKCRASIFEASNKDFTDARNVLDVFRAKDEDSDFIAFAVSKSRKKPEYALADLMSDRTGKLLGVDGIDLQVAQECVGRVAREITRARTEDELEKK
jgi:hypothetical protein